MSDVSIPLNYSYTANTTASAGLLASKKRTAQARPSLTSVAAMLRATGTPSSQVGTAQVASHFES